MLKESKERRIFYVYQNGNLGREGLNRFSLDRLGLPILLEDIMPTGVYKRKEGFMPWNKGNHTQCNTGRTHFKKGYRHSDEWFELTKERMTGENNPAWKGCKASYSSLHRRVYKKRGIPQYCEICGITDRLKWYDWANLTGKYADVMDYKRMCRKCHKEYDNKRRLQHGKPRKGDKYAR